MRSCCSDTGLSFGQALFGPGHRLMRTTWTISILGKSAWEWAELLIVPALFAVGAFLVQRFLGGQESRRQAKEEELAVDRNQQEVLKDYLDQMTQLLLDDDWPREIDFSNKDAIAQATRHPIIVVARARTLAVLRELDGKRNGYVVRFLNEANILSFVPLYRIDLSKANLIGASLRAANFSGTDFSKAGLGLADLTGASLIAANFIATDLSKAKLNSADLSWAKLKEADLSDAKLLKANLSNAILSDALLYSADLRWTDLRWTNLRWATLSRKADLTGADLRWADLTGADLTGATLSKADLTGADLTGANLTRANLTGANLTGANLSRTDLREIVRPGIFFSFVCLFIKGFDLNIAKNLTLAQFKAAKNWKQAIYSNDFRQKLGLPPTTQKEMESKPEGNDPEAAIPPSSGSTLFPYTTLFRSRKSVV